MDRKLQQAQEIERLIRLSGAARSSLNSAAISLKERFDIPSRLRDSLRSHPSGWLVGSLASGLAASLIFSRKSTPTEKKRRSLPLALLGLSLTAVRPFAKVWLTDQVKQYFSAQRTGFSASQPAPSPSSTPKIH